MVPFLELFYVRSSAPPFKMASEIIRSPMISSQAVKYILVQESTGWRLKLQNLERR